MIRTAPEGRWFIIAAWVIALALVLAALRSGSPVWWSVAFIWVLVAVWVVAFFRDPLRSGKRGDRYILAPADG